MNCGVAFLFDPETEAGLRASWQRLADAGVSDFMLGLDYPPHMTVLMAETIELDGLGKVLQAFAAARPPLPVTFSALGVFPDPAGVIYLSPTVTAPLLDLHARLWQAAAPCVTGVAGIYAPGVWAPHVTLGFGLPREKVGAGLSTLLPRHWPKSGQIAGLIYGALNPEGESRLERVLFR